MSGHVTDDPPKLYYYLSVTRRYFAISSNLLREYAMITAQEQTQENPDNQAPLIPLSDFRKSGRAPVEMHHLIFYNKDSLVKHGVICKFGRKWLVSEPQLYQWLREHGSNAGRPKRINEHNANKFSLT